MNNKRSLSSPEVNENRNNKKYISMAQSNVDVFSWNIFRNIFDEKLKDVAKKEDLGILKAEIEELKAENIKLKNEVSKLTSRIEFMDRRTRLSNIVVSGLKSNNAKDTRAEFMDICIKVLKINVNIISTRILNRGKHIIFNLGSTIEVNLVMAAKGKLKGSKVFIQKDFTDVEQRVRYNLRQVSMNISRKNKNVKVRLGDTCVFVNNKKYTWARDKIVAYSNDDLCYLQNILSECDCTYDICLIESHTKNAYNAANE